MSYEWDVFISYRREALVRDWTRRVFVPVFKQWWPHVCGGDPRIFIDEDSIEPGAPWPVALEDALRRSRCLLGVWSPDYFTSDWCLAEFHTMLRRQQATGATIVVPLQFSDGDFYPDEARALEWITVEPYNWMRSRSRANTRGFVRTVQNVCQRVAEVVRTAPAWDARWQVVKPTAAAAPAFSKPEF